MKITEGVSFEINVSQNLNILHKLNIISAIICKYFYSALLLIDTYF